MGLVTKPASGPYTATYNAVAVGLTLEGYTLRTSHNGQVLNRSDTYGDTPIDYIWRGGQMRVAYNCQDFASGNMNTLVPWATFPTMMTPTLPVGVMASDVAQSLVLTATANTPAVAVVSGKLVINTFTAAKSIIPPNFESQILFDSRLRQIPIELMLLPYVSASNVIFGVTT